MKNTSSLPGQLDRLHSFGKVKYPFFHFPGRMASPTGKLLFYLNCRLVFSAASSRWERSVRASSTLFLFVGICQSSKHARICFSVALFSTHKTASVSGFPQRAQRRFFLMLFKCQFQDSQTTKMLLTFKYTAGELQGIQMVYDAFLIQMFVLCNAISKCLQACT